MIKTLALAGALFGLGLGSAASAQEGASTSVAMQETAPMTIALVEAPRPWYAPRGVIVSRMTQSLPIYQAAVGLAEKHFILSDRKTLGGFYRWTSRAEADAFYNEAWRARVQRRYGRPAAMEWFNSPLALDGGAGGVPLGDKAVVTLVRVPIPAGTPRDRIIAGFQQSAPIYQHAAGLHRKWFIITEDNRIGGVYLWTDRAAADAFFNQAWHDRVRATRGADADIRYFEAPLTLKK